MSSWSDLYEHIRTDGSKVRLHEGHWTREAHFIGLSDSNAKPPGQLILELIPAVD